MRPSSCIAWATARPVHLAVLHRAHGGHPQRHSFRMKNSVTSIQSGAWAAAQPVHLAALRQAPATWLTWLRGFLLMCSHCAGWDRDSPRHRLGRRETRALRTSWCNPALLLLYVSATSLMLVA